eukprot:46624-Hanusia_phi.AAC.1
MPSGMDQVRACRPYPAYPHPHLPSSIDHRHLLPSSRPDFSCSSLHLPSFQARLRCGGSTTSTWCLCRRLLTVSSTVETRTSSSTPIWTRGDATPGSSTSGWCSSLPSASLLPPPSSL